MSDKLVKSEEVFVVPVGKGGHFALPAAMADTLLAQGIAPSLVVAPDVIHHAKTTWDDLCYLSTRDRKTMASPIVVVTMVAPNPDAPPEYDAYRGMVRFEFTDEFGASKFATHAMMYAATGELLPLWAWMSVQQVPFLARFGYIETRNSERHVVKPLPLDIEIV